MIYCHMFEDGCYNTELSIYTRKRFKKAVPFSNGMNDLEIVGADPCVCPVAGAKCISPGSRMLS